MKIFISWSGELSRRCAEILRVWIKCTLQASDPWISSQDIEKGSLWFSEISDQLKDTKVGIVCLTKNNKENPWILFESGALAKGLTINRVCTFLIDLKYTDIENPLAQFNHTSPNKEDMKSLLATINKELGPKALEGKILDTVFDMNWGTFEKNFENLLELSASPIDHQPVRSEKNILEEILDTTRTIARRIRLLEASVDLSYPLPPDSFEVPLPPPNSFGEPPSPPIPFGEPPSPISKS